MVGAKRNAEEGQQYWRITQFLAPFYTMIPPVLVRDTDSRNMGYGGHAWVPIDDDNTWTWNLSANPHRPYEGSAVVTEASRRPWTRSTARSATGTTTTCWTGRCSGR